MIKLKKPEDDVKVVFLDCISNIKNSDLKEKLEHCTGEIIEIAEMFEKNMKIHEVHKIKKHNNVGGIVTKEEMKKVYNNKMVKSGQPGRKYYDKYITLARNGICPLCGQREVSTLDHYLPKAKYPALAVTPSNLVPACRECNTTKSDKVFLSSIEETIHPYFDDIQNEVWLYSKIIEEDEISFVFEVRRPEEWDELLYGRVKNHFKEFNLNKLYSTQAAVEFSGIRYRLMKVYNEVGNIRLKTHIRECYESYSIDCLNSWKSAMYRELSENEWFYNNWIVYHANI